MARDFSPDHFSVGSASPQFSRAVTLGVVIASKAGCRTPLCSLLTPWHCNFDPDRSTHFCTHVSSRKHCSTLKVFGGMALQHCQRGSSVLLQHRDATLTEFKQGTLPRCECEFWTLFPTHNVKLNQHSLNACPVLPEKTRLGAFLFVCFISTYHKNRYYNKVTGNLELFH